MEHKHDNTSTVYLIDGSSFLYRAYYALQPLHTSTGEPVQAVYGFCRMLKRLIDQFHPHYMALVWDAPGKTHRHELYEAYKAERPEKPQDMSQQKERITAFARQIGIPNVTHAGVEADDVLASLAHQCVQQGYNVVLVTSDKDLRQVVSPNIHIYHPFQEKMLDVASIEKKYGIPVDKLPFYFALVGDTTDGIPGVKGVGPKTAVNIVHQFSSLEELYDNLDQVEKERVRSLLKESQDNAFLSRKLFMLASCQPEVTPEDMAFCPDDWSNARSFFQELEFTSLLKGISEGEPKKQENRLLFHERYGYHFQTITQVDHLQEVIAYIYRRGCCAIDTETDRLHPFKSNLAGVSLCADQGYAYYIPVGHLTREQQIDLQELQKHLAPMCADARVAKYLHNAKFDMHVLHRHGMPLHGIDFDTLIAAYLVMRSKDRLALHALSQSLLEQPMYTYQEVVKDQGYAHFAQVPILQAYDYAAADAHQTYALVSVLAHKLHTSDQDQLFYDVEMPLMRVLYEMEKTGIIVDTPVLDKLRTVINAELGQLQDKISSYLGQEHKHINLNSPQQIAYILFDVLGLTPRYKTAGKTAYSTSYEVLKKLSRIHPVPDLIRRYRELYKLKSTYIDTLGTYVHPETGRVHTTFHQAVTATGRLSSSDPNLQNIPLDAHDRGIHIRSAFQAPEGHVLLSADYSQIELRILAHVSGDAHLQEAFESGDDIHSQTAASLFGVDQHAVTAMQRQLAKRINFSIIYGLTPYGLSQDLEISRKEAKSYIDAYMASYPSVTHWMDDVVAYTQSHGYAETLWGRRRYIPSIYDNNKNIFELAKRTAINTVIQGTAADLMKAAMIDLHQALLTAYPDVAMLLQVHDELIFSVPESLTQEVANFVRRRMTEIVNWSVAMHVSIATGKTWHDISK